MKNKLLYVAVIMCMILSLVPIAISAPSVQAIPPTTWYVDDDKVQCPTANYQTIQEAIDAASAGNTIIVYDGTYYESLTIDKSLTITSVNGSDVTIIDTDSDYGGVSIEASDVTFGAEGQGFHVTGDGTWDDGESLEGIYIPAIEGDDISNVTIAGNEVYSYSWGIDLYDEDEEGDDDSSISGCTITGNEVHGCEWGINLDYDIGEIYDNTITGNTVYDCWYEDEYGEWGTGIFVAAWDANARAYGNTVENNSVSDCYRGIVLECDGGALYQNTIDNNDVSECYYGIMADCDEGELYQNTVSDNDVYCVVDGGSNGIYFYVDPDGGHIYDCTIEGNTVYGWDKGIFLYEESPLTIEDTDIVDNVLYNGSTGNDYGIEIYICNDINIHGNDIAYSSEKGITLVASDYVYITSNTVQNNSEGIYMEDSFFVEISGNDIRDNNPANTTGIAVYDSEYVSATCNNIEGNGMGLYVYHVDSYCVDANNNWWGAASGPSGAGFNGSGDEIQLSGAGCVNIDPNAWFTAELNLSAVGAAPVVLNTEAVPATVSLYDTLYTYNDLYELGPDYTDIIVEIECPDPDNPCEMPTATVNLGALLVDLLPADFEATYVSTWSEMGQDYWDEWLDYLSDVEIEGYYSDEICFFDYELQLGNLFFDNEYCWDDCGGDCIECFSLEYFFSNEYCVDHCDGYCDCWYEPLMHLIVQELRTGQHQVEVTLESCGGISTTVYVPLVVADFQLPLEGGPNLRSTPVTLDPAWNNLSAIMGDGINDIAALVTWNTTLGRWVEPGSNVVFTPLTAYYIIMENGSETQMRFIVERDVTTPPTRTLQAGWNLVAPAPAYGYWPDEYEDWPYCSPFPAMSPWDALYSVEWTQAVIPHEDVDYEECFYYQDIPLEKMCYWKEFYQDDWEVYIGDEFDDEFVTAGGGYWVYMNSSDLLAGFSYTPVPWTAFPYID